MWCRRGLWPNTLESALLGLDQGHVGTLPRGVDPEYFKIIWRKGETRSNERLGVC